MSKSSEVALRVATVVWAALTLIHFTIWTLICILGGELQSPWWLWIAVPPGAVLGVFWLARRRDQ